MINKEEFELHKSIVEWLMQNGEDFLTAMSIVTYSIDFNKTIPQSYFELTYEKLMDKVNAV